MEYLLLIITFLCLALQNIVTKQYNNKTRNPNTTLYTAIVAFFAMIFFVVASKGKFEFNSNIIIYSVGFALFYGAALLGNNNALKTGSLSITALIMQCSLIVPTLYGIVLLKETIGVLGWIGIVLLLLALFLVNFSNEKVKISAKWLIWITIGFFGNGMCSVVQKKQQIKFDGGYKNEFMIIALLVVFVAFSVMGAVKSNGLKKDIKNSSLYALVNGVSNGAVNLLIMILIALMPTAIVYTTVSAGSMAAIFIVSLTIYKEKLTKTQTLGYLCGILSVILLNA